MRWSLMILRLYHRITKILVHLRDLIDLDINLFTPHYLLNYEEFLKI